MESLRSDSFLTTYLKLLSVFLFDDEKPPFINATSLLSSSDESSKMNIYLVSTTFFIKDGIFAHR